MGQKFGLIGKQKNGAPIIKHPKYARFKMAIRCRGKIANATNYYAGYDIQPTYIDGKLVYYRNESIAWDKLMELVRSLRPWEYYAASIYVNLTNDLRFLDGNAKTYNDRLITVFPDKEATGDGMGNKPIYPEWLPYQSKQYTEKTCIKIDIEDTLRKLHWKKQQRELQIRTWNNT